MLGSNLNGGAEGSLLSALVLLVYAAAVWATSVYAAIDVDEIDGDACEFRMRFTSWVPASFQRSTLSTNIPWSISLGEVRRESRQGADSDVLAINFFSRDDIRNN